MRSIFLTLGLITLVANLAWSTEGDDVLAVLKSKDFYEAAGKQGGRVWSEEDLKQLAALKSAIDAEPMLRLRANKVLVDVAAKARLNTGPADEHIVVAGFRHLETNLKQAKVKELLDGGFTHYHISRRDDDGRLLFLIERVGKTPSGGLNLEWDPVKKEIIKMTGWGILK
ncbi:hypothetical protein [Anatilimnocola floriformis]|uniref:hypothetical protein n=1 Tax=Anatilimnocola floriformis TaxID=2948575 RepID=UPI0020C535EF|nr:hypothetical protein [Anatilimnocola floriformis]